MRVGGGGGDLYIQGVFFISKKVNLYSFSFGVPSNQQRVCGKPFLYTCTCVFNALNGENFTSF